MAMHLAETTDELQMLGKREGKFVELLESLGLWTPDIYPLGTTVLDLLKQLSHGPNCLIIHGNYLTEPEIQFVAEQRGSMSIVYCPRTHHYFGHKPYPLEHLLNAGINVCLLYTSPSPRDLSTSRMPSSA